ncbi:hypothetical protein [Fibrobacter sp. UWB12]|uniref:hypothetical protein n=1 Tax=Fibrobacter sp. UWB12 TaxID=1896203 RepID=UPI00090F314C|nr:hypothetical protein [Fibrobacter sp. UWB12]SHK99958.1 hypothetical protein SAMN05720759_11222 [Fibrobacter sp. UWB12]
MCVVIDANVISSFFKSGNEKHEKLVPLLKWVVLGRAKIVLGGKLYTEEIVEKQDSLISFIKELNNFNKIHFFSNEDVSNVESQIKKIEKDTDFDDPHIIALLIVSRATVLCSDDSRMFKYVHKIKEYNKLARTPKIYTTQYHEPQDSILCDENICSYGEHEKLPEKIANMLLAKMA